LDCLFVFPGLPLSAVYCPGTLNVVIFSDMPIYGNQLLTFWWIRGSALYGICNVVPHHTALGPKADPGIRWFNHRNPSGACILPPCRPYCSGSIWMCPSPKTLHQMSPSGLMI
jgi:hypothetical protein